MKNIYEILRKLGMTKRFLASLGMTKRVLGMTRMLAIFMLITCINLLAETDDLYYPGVINLCFSSSLIGNTVGDFAIQRENGIIVTPYDWFNALSLEYGIIDLERKYIVKNTKWHLDGKYPMNVFRLEVEDHDNTDELLELLKANNDVLFAELDAITRTFYTPNDPDISLQWALEKVQAFDAWDLERGSEEILIGIVDTGIKWNHPDLRANIWINEAELPGMIINWESGTITGEYGTSGNQTGGGANYWGDVMGWDFVSTTSGGQSNNPFQNLVGNIHGTHVAGIAAAVGNNYIGLSGLAPNVKIVSTKHTPFNFQTSNLTNAYAGIYYLADKGAHIINCSWGGFYDSQQVSALATSYAWSHNSLVVAASGNEGWDHDNEWLKIYPACSPNSIAVAGTDYDDQKANFSNFGSDIDVSAPAVSIYSTAYGLVGNNNNTYEYGSGTSMAAPIVSGIAALLLSQNPNLTLVEMRAHLRNGADLIDHLNPGFENKLGGGRVNALKSLLLARGQLNYDLFATPLQASSTVAENTTADITVTIRNIGTDLADGYTVKLMQVGDITPLFTLPGAPLLMYETAVFLFEWTPDDIGKYELYGEIDWIDDEDNSNNQTEVHNLVVLPDQFNEYYIGDVYSTEYLYNSFVNYNYQNSISQTIYLAEEMNFGTIFKLNYRFHGAGDITTFNNIKLYMTTTEKIAFSHHNDWIPYSDFTLVFSGELNVNIFGYTDIEIVLHHPFVYDSGNLVIMAIRDHYYWYTETNAFQFTTLPGQYRTLSWRSESIEPLIFEPFPLANSRLAGFTNLKVFMAMNEDHEHVEITDENNLPLMTKLIGNYPNPFNPETTIKFNLAHESNLRVDIYNIRGQKIKTLLDAVYKPGEHSIVWNGMDDNGSSLANGIYFYRMTAEEYSAVKKMVLMK